MEAMRSVESKTKAPLDHAKDILKMHTTTTYEFFKVSNKNAGTLIFTFDVTRKRRLFKMGTGKSLTGGQKCEGKRMTLYITRQYINQYVCIMSQLNYTSLP